MATVSVLISAHNVAPFIEASLTSMVEQTYRDLEILVVDDGSTDATFARMESVKDPRIRIFRQSNQGKAATLNTLMEQARGDYFVIQDGDDISHPRRVAALLEAMAKNSGIELAMSGHALIIADRVVAPRAKALSPAECRQLIAQFKMPAHDPTMMVKSQLARRLRFEESLIIGQGLDFILRAGEIAAIQVVGESLYYYRVNPNSITRRRPEERARHLLSVINRARLRRGMELLSFGEFYAANKAMLEDPDNNMAGHFTESAYLSVISGDRSQALQTASTSLKYLGRGWGYGKPLIYALVPRFAAAAIKRKLGQK